MTAMPERDGDLVSRLGSDPLALEVFYRRHVGDVTRFAARRCGNAHDLADVVSQTFMAAISGAHTFRVQRTRDGSARGWLLRIASNEIHDRRRHERREQAIGSLDAGRRLLDDDDRERLEALISSARIAPALSRALDGLSTAERNVVCLVFIDDLSRREAAAVLGISEVAVRARLSRARRRLRKTLGPQMQTLRSQCATSSG